MTQDETPNMNMTENVDDAVFKYLSSTEMSPELRNAVMNLFMELFEKEANETVGILGESRMLFRAEFTDYRLEQETLKHEARMYEERRQQEEIDLQQKSRQSRIQSRASSRMEEEPLRPVSRTLAQIRNERAQSRAQSRAMSRTQSRNDRSSSSMSVRINDRPPSSISRRGDDDRPPSSISRRGDDDRPPSSISRRRDDERPMSRGRPESKNYRPASRAHTDSPRPFSTTASGEPSISQEQLKQESDAILSGMQAAENKQMLEKKRQQEELQKKREEKIAARNDLQNQAKAILDRALEITQANTSNKEKVDMQLQARLDDLKKKKMQARGDVPVDDDLEEIKA